MLNPINAPKAKPVKIRIMSGGEEHSSLDSLRHHFNLEDVEKLLDGRLVNWLNKIEEPDLARKVSDLQQTKTENSTNDENFLMSLIRIFFPDTHAETLKDVANEWMKDNVYKENARSLYKQLIWNDVDLLITLYKEHSFDFNWKDIFKHHYCNCTEQDLFRLGKELYEDRETEEYENLGERMIMKAAGLDYKEAMEYKDKNVKMTAEKKQNYIIERRKQNGYDEQEQESFQEMLKIWKSSESTWDFYSKTRDQKYQSFILRPVRDFLNQVFEYYTSDSKNASFSYSNLSKNITDSGSLSSQCNLYKEKALLLIMAKISFDNKILSKDNIEKYIKKYGYEKQKLESYPLYQCIVGEDVSSILSPNEIEILRSPQDIKKKILIIFEHIMDF